MPAAIKHVYTVVCEYIVIDENKKPTFVNVIRNAALSQLPGMLSTVSLVTNISNAQGKECRISLVDPSGKEVPCTIGILEPIELRNKYCIQSSLMGVTLAPAIFFVEGVHHIVIRVEGKIIHREPFGVFLKEANQDGNDNPDKSDG